MKMFHEETAHRESGESPLQIEIMSWLSVWTRGDNNKKRARHMKTSNQQHLFLSYQTDHWYPQNVHQLKVAATHSGRWRPTNAADW